MVVGGGSFQFRALNNTTAQPVPVAWRLGDPLFATISSSGLLTISVCPGPAISTLTALLLADTTVTATIRVTRVDFASARISIAGLVYVSSGTPIRLDSLAGDMDTMVNLNPSGCGDLTEVQFRIRQGATTTIVATAPANPPTIMAQHFVLRWNADGFPNGQYQIMATATGPQAQLSTPANTVTVRHP